DVATEAAGTPPAEEPRRPSTPGARAPNEWATAPSARKSSTPVPQSESPIEGTRWTPTTLADPPGELQPLASLKKPDYLPPGWQAPSARMTVPESAARALEARGAAARPPVREAVAAPPPIREPVPSLPPRRTSLPFVIVGLLVIAVAGYYAYRSDTFAPAIAWLHATPAYQTLERWAAGWGAGDRGAESAQAVDTTAAAPTAGDTAAP